MTLFVNRTLSALQTFIKVLPKAALAPAAEYETDATAAFDAYAILPAATAGIVTALRVQRNLIWSLAQREERSLWLKTIVVVVLMIFPVP